jgi:hypothetical protein
MWHHIPENSLLQSLLRFSIDGYGLVLSRHAEIVNFTSVASRMVLVLTVLPLSGSQGQF